MFTPEQVEQLREIIAESAARAQSPWMGIEAAAAYADCSTNSIVNAACAGHLTRHKPSGTGMTRYHRDELDKWIRGRK